MSDETGTFQLVQYFPKVYQFVERCLLHPQGYNGGMAEIAGRQKFHVKLDRVGRGDPDSYLTILIVKRSILDKD